MYDVGAGVCTVTAAGQNRNWAELRRDDAIGDPEDRFVVYVGGHQDVQVRFRLDEFGWPIALHKDFDQTLIGSPTIWPERLRQFVWWSPERSLWDGDRPREWETHSLSSHDRVVARPGPPPPAPFSPHSPKKMVPRGNPGPRIR